MALLKILTDEHPLLRQQAKKITTFDPSLKKLAADMFETMQIAGGVGLAATQVGILRRLIVIEIPEDKEEGDKHYKLAICNPEIVKRDGNQYGPEGCLSIPGWVGDVNRELAVIVKGQDLNGREIRVKAKGFLARAFQHEIDHLNGILFTDRVEDITTLRKVRAEEEDLVMA